MSGTVLTSGHFGQPSAKNTEQTQASGEGKNHPVSHSSGPVFQFGKPDSLAAFHSLNQPKEALHQIPSTLTPSAA